MDKLSPKRMAFGHEEWVCVKPDEFDSLIDQIRADDIFIRIATHHEPRLEKLFNAVFAKCKSRRISGEIESAELRSTEELDSELTERTNAVLRNENTKFVSLDDFTKTVAASDIRAKRRAAKMTQKDLAKKAKLTQPQLSRLERDPASASVSTLRRVAAALGIKIYI